jgi:ribose transport system permease protein
MIKERFRQLSAVHGSQMSAIFALFVLVAVLSVIAPNFLTANNILSVLHQVAYVAVMAVGITFLILSGHIDLAASGTLALTVCIMGDLFVNKGVNGVVAVLTGFLIGPLCGAISATFITKLRLVPFIVTLATMNIYRGVASVYTNGYSSQGMPPIVNFIGTGKIGSVPISVVLMLIVYVITWFVLNKTSFGMNLQAVGGNVNAAQLSGINVTKVRLMVYAYHGCMVFIAGLILAGRMNTTNPSLATGVEMNCIAAAVIGGTSMKGGIGSVWGTLIGAIIMGVVSNGMNQLAISSFWQQLFLGCIVLLSVSIDSIRTAKKGA